MGAWSRLDGTQADGRKTAVMEKDNAMIGVG